jgi:hypothetical protein
VLARDAELAQQAAGAVDLGAQLLVAEGGVRREEGRLVRAARLDVALDDPARVVAHARFTTTDFVSV